MDEIEVRNPISSLALNSPAPPREQGGSSHFPPQAWRLRG